MNTKEINALKIEAFDHIENGRYRLAFDIAKNLYNNNYIDEEINIILARTLLENNEPAESINYAHDAVNFKDSSLITRLFRGYILQRLGIIENSLSDIDYVINNSQKILANSYLTKATSLAFLGSVKDGYKYIKAAKELDSSIKDIDLRIEYFKIAIEILSKKSGITITNARKFLEYASFSLKHKDIWFTSIVIENIKANKSLKDYLNEAFLLELESLYSQFKFKKAFEFAEKIKTKFEKDRNFQRIYKAIKSQLNKNTSDNIKYSSTEDKINLFDIQQKSMAEFFENKFAKVFSAKIFDVIEEKNKGRRYYYSQKALLNLKFLGIEVIFDNPFFESETKEYNGLVIWSLNNTEIGRNSFKLTAKLGWDSIIFAQTIGSENSDFWNYGQGFVEVLLNNTIILKKYFLIGKTDVSESKIDSDNENDSKESNKKTDESIEIIEAKDNKSIEELVEELNNFIGLDSVKTAIQSFITYLTYIKEREKFGLRSGDKPFLNALFLGNPGTGKTTVARLLGNLFKAMGLLEKGHVVEVDRTGLVGQYIGETAQKTDKIIKEAFGGVLFIDEAYSLIKKGDSGQDFGKEAIDTLLKQMEDKKGKFFVVAAGYPDDMQIFIEANPGMKSRFSHTFIFEDYTPDELIKILKMMIHKDDYEIEPDAENIIKKHLIDLYRKRDKTFGNARLVRSIVEDLKMQVSKRVIQLPENQRTKETFTKIIKEDTVQLFSQISEKEFDIPINEEALEEALFELEKFNGLKSVKDEVKNLIKLARFYNEQGENLKEKFSSHILFLGNPGTGKTSVARILSKIYSALGILPKGHLVEADRQKLVSGYVGQTAIQTSQIIDSAIGGTLFIDEAYTLAGKGDSKDFGQEAIDTLLKRMEDERGKFIVIAAGYTEEMNLFLNSNSGIQSRFNKKFTFEDYIPDELLEIFIRIAEKDKLKLEEGIKEELLKYFNEIYRERDKSFGNARIIRNIFENAKQKMLIRIADVPKNKRTEIVLNTMLKEDISEITKSVTNEKKYVVKGNPEKLEKYLEELNNLTGLEQVKKDVRKLISSIKVEELRREHGMKILHKNLHSVFTGNPGTGKTTVARLLSKIYKELGLLERGHLIEVDRTSLVAGYQGQTATKTEKVISSSIGGTLFIDEAYTLYKGHNDFGMEVIETLLKKMEDLKGQFIVIVAGYTKEMKQFLDSNPGLYSRFTNFFHFEDYQPRELLEISNLLAKTNGYELDEGALQQLLEIYNELYQNRDNNFGNARTAKKVLYRAISNQEERIARMYNVNEEDLKKLTMEDFEKI